MFTDSRELSRSYANTLQEPKTYEKENIADGGIQSPCFYVSAEPVIAKAPPGVSQNNYSRIIVPHQACISPMQRVNAFSDRMDGAAPAAPFGTAV